MDEYKRVFLRKQLKLKPLGEQVRDNMRSIIIIGILVLLPQVRAENQLSNSDCDSLKSAYLSASNDTTYWWGYSETPSPVGGYAQLASNVVYPESAIADGIEGKVVVLFAISKDGEALCPEIKKSVRDDIDMAAISAVEQTKWTSVTQLGNPVD